MECAARWLLLVAVIASAAKHDTHDAKDALLNRIEPIKARAGTLSATLEQQFSKDQQNLKSNADLMKADRSKLADLKKALREARAVAEMRRSPQTMDVLHWTRALHIARENMTGLRLRHLSKLQECTVRHSTPSVGFVRTTSILREPFSGWQYLHIYKSGGTSVETKLRLYNATISHHMPQVPTLTFVRDPWDHFVSGYRQVLLAAHPTLGQTKQHGTKLSKLLQDALRNGTTASEFLSSTLAHFLITKGGYDVKRLNPHMAPQSWFMMDQSGHLHTNLRAVFDMQDMWLLGINSRKNAHDEKDVAHMSGILNMPPPSGLSEQQTLAICNLIQVDYCCLDFDWPQQCKSKVNLTC
mmetsp:Transcript_25344/g.64385  ORF Transcript_25344/g.64385 Transcript_25344/m.64385 type:complete len:355 (-) Transcript_25344:198-1262(-)|eukprot:CAMPEP_0115828432 /NCGR_PEP_ID=MMETSP0287-20121206/570_1 /TAXON_ID=412157 /ORGANISM="Chrysochromulina rotalis, Strain UIO044" /LENGTH=354 /DNA_ID=CAMNT_0003281647 /DNA_START=56 /DNA_END=1120 /DNA_ORIENTATION=-